MSKRKSEQHADDHSSNLREHRAFYSQNYSISCTKFLLYLKQQDTKESSVQSSRENDSLTGFQFDLHKWNKMSVVHCIFARLTIQPSIGHFIALLIVITTVFLKNLHMSICLCFYFKHYTKDADGLCTSLIKPKVEEGTVAAQDEFSRSKAQFVSL